MSLFVLSILKEKAMLINFFKAFSEFLYIARYTNKSYDKYRPHSKRRKDFV